MLDSAIPWTASRQASLSIINSQCLLKLMSLESVMPSNHLILCPPLLFPPSIFPSIRVFSKKSVLPVRWPKYWSFSFSISPSKEYSGLISFRIDWGWHWMVHIIWWQEVEMVIELYHLSFSIKIFILELFQIYRKIVKIQIELLNILSPISLMIRNLYHYGTFVTMVK